MLCEPRKTVMPDHDDAGVQHDSNLGVYAHVHGDVSVAPVTAELSVTLRIDATNQTAATIQLREPYFLPAMANVHNITARDDKGDLDVLYGDERHGVKFREDACIAPGQRYGWQVSFRCNGPFSVTGSSILGPYSVRVDSTFNNVNVVGHDFTYQFRFHAPGGIRSRLVRKLNIIQSNTGRIPGTIRRRFSFTDCTVSFQLRPGETMKISLATSYDFSSGTALIAGTMGGAILTMAGKAILTAGGETILALVTSTLGWMGSMMGVW